MQLLLPSDEVTSLPVIVGTGESLHGARLGGLPPHGVVPSRRTPSTRYFATLPLVVGGTAEVSIFLSFDFDQMAEASRRVFGPVDQLVELVVHEQRPRSTDASALASELSAHPLIVLGTAPDSFLSGGNTVVESGHKIGGRPYVEQPRASMVEELQLLSRGGYRQFVQIGFPSGQQDAPVSGDWPFGDGIFHLFVNADASAGAIDWRWLWEF